MQDVVIFVVNTSYTFEAQSNPESTILLSTQPTIAVFLVPHLSGKVIKLYIIKKAHTIKAQGWHDTMMIFHCNYWQKKMC